MVLAKTPHTRGAQLARLAFYQRAGKIEERVGRNEASNILAALQYASPPVAWELAILLQGFGWPVDLTGVGVTFNPNGIAPFTEQRSVTTSVFCDL